MKNSFVGLSDTLAGREFAGFLRDHGFRLVADHDGDDFSCTVFQGSGILLSFTYERGLGENFAVAEIGAPIDPDSVRWRSNGWSLIGEVWKEVYENFHKARRELPYPHELGREQEVVLLSEALVSFLNMVGNNLVSISKPRYRMDM